MKNKPKFKSHQEQEFYNYVKNMVWAWDHHIIDYETFAQKLAHPDYSDICQYCRLWYNGTHDCKKLPQ